MGILDQTRQWMTPERGLAMQAIGMGLSQLGAGQPVNLAPAYGMLQQRQQQAQLRKVMEQPGLMDGFTPQQKAVLATMPENMAVEIIMQRAFGEKARPIEVNGQLVDPSTGQVIGDYRDPAAPPSPTDDMREYEAARAQGYPGTLQEWILDQRKAGATTVNVGPTGVDYGQPPADMAWLRNPDGTVRLDPRGAPMAVVITGSDTDRKRVGSIAEMAGGAIDAAEKAAGKDETTARAGSVVLQDIGRVRQKVESAPWYSPATGFGAEWLSNVGGTTAADVNALTGTVRANIGFDRLQRMREDSPTGGALGNVTEKELAFLQSVLGSLEQSQSEAQMLENLSRLEEIYTEIMRKASAYPNAAKYGFDGVVAGGEDPLGILK